MGTSIHSLKTFEVEHSDGVEKFLEKRDVVGKRAINRFRELYENREMWLQPGAFDTIDSPFSAEYTQRIIKDFVLVPSHLRLQYMFEPEKDPEDTPDFISKTTSILLYVGNPADERDVGFRPQIEWVSDDTISVYDEFTIEVPFSNEVVEEFDYCTLDIVDEDGEFTTNVELQTTINDDTEEFSQWLAGVTFSETTVAQREAFMLLEDGFENVLVAEGKKTVSIMDMPRAVKKMQHFPVDSIRWDVNANEELDVDETSDNYTSFMYNTNMISKDAVRERLDTIYRNDVTTLEYHRQLGLLLDYLEADVDEFVENYEQDIRSSYKRHIQQLYYLLENESDIDREQLEYAKHNEYAFAFENREAAGERGRMVVTTLREFIDEYNLDVNESILEVLSENNTGPIPQTFEEFWVDSYSFPYADEIESV